MKGIPALLTSLRISVKPRANFPPFLSFFHQVLIVYKITDKRLKTTEPPMIDTWREKKKRCLSICKIIHLHQLEKSVETHLNYSRLHHRHMRCTFIALKFTIKCNKAAQFHRNLICRIWRWKISSTSHLYLMLILQMSNPTYQRRSPDQ